MIKSYAVAKLPDPGTPFALVLSRTQVTDAGLWAYCSRLHWVALDCTAD